MKNKYEIKMTSRFKKDLKTVRKRKYFLIEKTGKGIGRMRVIYTYQDINLYYFNKKSKIIFFLKILQIK